MSELDALLGELRERAAVLAKAQPAPEATVAAAPEPAEEAGAEDVEAAAEAGAEQTEGDEAETVAKSFTVKDAEGNEHEAIDGYALIKALGADIAALRADLDALKGQAPAVDAEALTKSFTDRFDAASAQTETVAKALSDAMTGLKAAQDANAALLERVGKQDEVIKSLTAVVEKIGAEGSGRRSAVSVHERPSVVAKSEPAPSIGEIFAKTNELSRAGKIDLQSAALITASVNSGRGIPSQFASLFA